MGFKLDTGTIVVIIVMVIFYLRLMQLRGRKRKLARKEAANTKPKKDKGTEKNQPGRNEPSIQVTSWWLVALGALLMCVGLAMNNSSLIPSLYSQYWWIVMSLGVFTFVFCFR